MSTIHEFKCDGCRKKVPAKYNGEHWLPPDGWMALWDPLQAECTDEHLCEKCRPRKRKLIVASGFEQIEE